MIPPPAFGPSQHTLAFARKRDERICWLLSLHPVTAAMLADLRWFPSKHKSRKRLRRLEAQRRIRLVGTVCRKFGRPEHVYCRWQPKSNQLLHEVELTEVCFRLDAGTILRGPLVAGQVVRPDAELHIRGQVYYLELDRGTMSRGQIARRFARYEGCRHFVLWVCSSRERLEALRSGAERIRGVALFTTMAQALAAPHGDIWIDFQGGRASLPREIDGRFRK